VVAAQRGHEVTLFDAASEIGGQFNLAKRIPGKEEFHETLRYYRRQLELNRVRVELGRRMSADELARGPYDEIVIATGVMPRTPAIAGIDHPKVLSYLQVIRGERTVGGTVAIVGAGGIGFDVAEFLTHDGHSTSLDVPAFMSEWGIDQTLRSRGGLCAQGPRAERSPREVYLLQRKTSKPGEGLGKTTGWVHRTALRRRGVHMLAGVTYERIDDAGLHLGGPQGIRVLPVDHVVICAGQEPQRDLLQPLQAAGRTPHLIGGADVALELDAKRAIDQGSRLGAQL
jgi:2,4-dienoyl-CoA reductase (NADPH2)